MIGSVAGLLNGRCGKISILIASARTAAFVLVALGSLIGLGVDRASAQSYYFDFTNGASGANLFSFIATISGVTCNPSCTLTTPSNLSGTENIGGNQYAMAFSTSGAFGPDNVFNVNTGVDVSGLNYQANGVVYNVYQVGSAGTAGVESNVTIAYSGGNNPEGVLTYGQNAAPAPIPGSGLLSCIVLGLAGLMFRPKRLWSKTRTAVARLVPKSSMANA